MIRARSADFQTMSWLQFHEVAELVHLVHGNERLPFVDSSISNQESLLKFFDGDLETLLDCSEVPDYKDLFVQVARKELLQISQEREKARFRSERLLQIITRREQPRVPSEPHPCRNLTKSSDPLNDLIHLFPLLSSPPTSSNSVHNGSSTAGSREKSKKPPGVPIDAISQGNVSEIPFLFESALLRRYLNSSVFQPLPPNLPPENDEVCDSYSTVCSEILGSSLLNVCQGNVRRWKWNAGHSALVLKKTNFLDLKGALLEFSKRPSFGGDDVASYLQFLRFVLRLDGLRGAVGGAEEKSAPIFQCQGSNLYFLKFPCNKEKLFRSLTSGRNSLLPLVDGVRFVENLNRDFSFACSKGESFSPSRLSNLIGTAPSPYQSLIFLKACWFAVSLGKPMLGLVEPSSNLAELKCWTNSSEAEECWQVLCSKVSFGHLSALSAPSSPNGRVPSPFSDWFEILDLSTSECILAIRKDLWLIWASNSVAHRLSSIPTSQTVVKHFNLPTVNFPLVDKVRKFSGLRKMLSWLTKLDENRTLQFVLPPDHPDFSTVYDSIFSEIDMWNKSAADLDKVLTQAYVNPSVPNVLTGLLSKILIKKRHAVDKSVVSEIRENLYCEPRDSSPASSRIILHVLEKLCEEPSSSELALSIDRAAKSASYKLLKTFSKDVLSTTRRGKLLKRRSSQIDPEARPSADKRSSQVNISDATAVGADPSVIKDLERRFVCTGTYGTGELVRLSNAKKRKLQEKRIDPEFVAFCKDSSRSIRREYLHVLEDAGCLAEILVERGRIHWNDTLASLQSLNPDLKKGAGKNVLSPLELLDIRKPLLWDRYDLKNSANTAKRKKQKGPFSEKDSWLLLAELVASKNLYQTTSQPGLPEELRKKLFLSLSLVDEPAFEVSVAASMATRFVVVDAANVDAVFSLGFSQAKIPLSMGTELGSLQDTHHPFRAPPQLKGCGLVLENFYPAPFDPPHVHRRTGKGYLKYVDSKWAEKKARVDELITLACGSKNPHAPSKKRKKDPNSNLQKLSVVEAKLYETSEWFWSDPLLFGDDARKRSVLRDLTERDRTSTLTETMSRTLAFLEYAYQCNYSQLVRCGDPKKRIRNILEAAPPYEPYYHCFKRDLVGNVLAPLGAVDPSVIVPTKGPNTQKTASPALRKCAISVFDCHSPPNQTSKKRRMPSAPRAAGTWAATNPNLELGGAADARSLPVYDDSLVLLFTGNLEDRRKEHAKNIQGVLRKSHSGDDHQALFDVNEFLISTFDFYVNRSEALALDWHCCRNIKPGEKVIHSTGMAKPLKRSQFQKIETKADRANRKKRKHHPDQEDVLPNSVADQPLSDDQRALRHLLDNFNSLKVNWKLFHEIDDFPGKQNVYDERTGVYWVTRYQSTAD